MNIKAGRYYWKTRAIGSALLINACLLTFGLNAQEIRRALPSISSERIAIPSQASTRSSADEQAKFLAGIDLPKNSPLSPLQSTDPYRQHAQEFSKAWSNFTSTHLNKMQAWSQSELQPKLPSASVLIYLFGGPDFINAFALFPNIPTMVLCGLEPVGKIVPPEQLGEARLIGDLAALRTSTDSTLKWSFFIRKDMKVDLQRGDLQGVAPILYAFLALSGNFIEQADFTRAGGSPAIRITYRKHPSAPRQVLYYINANLANGASGGLFSWLSSLGPSIGYLKAASYLMHHNEFSASRNLLLNRCLAILQDDSGIPYRYFLDNRWQIYLYGKYTRPIELFKNHFQDDLRTAYQTSGIVDFLPFGTSYQWRPGESNLMLAIRKNSGQ